MRHSFNPQYLLKKFDQDVTLIKRTIIQTLILSSKSKNPDLMLGPLPINPLQDHSITLNISFTNIQNPKSNNELIMVKVHSYDPDTKNSLVLKEIKISTEHHADHLTVKIPVFSISKLLYLTFKSHMGIESSYQINYAKLDCTYPISKASQSFEYQIDFPFVEQIYIEINPEKITQMKVEEIELLMGNIIKFGYLSLIFSFLPNYEQNIKILNKFNPKINYQDTKKTKETKDIKIPENPILLELMQKIKVEYNKFQKFDKDLMNLKIEKERCVYELNEPNYNINKTRDRNKKELYQIFKTKLENRREQIEKFQQIKMNSVDEERISFILRGYHQKLSQELDKLKEYEEELLSKKNVEGKTKSETLDQTLVKIRTYEKLKKDTQLSVHHALIQLFYHLMDT